MLAAEMLSHMTIGLSADMDPIWLSFASRKMEQEFSKYLDRQSHNNASGLAFGLLILHLLLQAVTTGHSSSACSSSFTTSNCLLNVLGGWIGLGSLTCALLLLAHAWFGLGRLSADTHTLHLFLPFPHHCFRSEVGAGKQNPAVRREMRSGPNHLKQTSPSSIALPLALSFSAYSFLFWTVVGFLLAFHHSSRPCISLVSPSARPVSRTPLSLSAAPALPTFKVAGLTRYEGVGQRGAGEVGRQATDKAVKEQEPTQRTQRRRSTLHQRPGKRRQTHRRDVQNQTAVRLNLYGTRTSTRQKRARGRKRLQKIELNSARRRRRTVKEHNVNGRRKLTQSRPLLSTTTSSSNSASERGQVDVAEMCSLVWIISFVLAVNQIASMRLLWSVPSCLPALLIYWLGGVVCGDRGNLVIALLCWVMSGLLWWLREQGLRKAWALHSTAASWETYRILNEQKWAVTADLT
eukprot:gb/GEZN01004493.1/.p1 GENE.gb/GEZN01004493.1/~~gb/GEZN01004493.1/.p1  ORF type:complete len:463 (-),score=33.57 gb/GEZN01004493.1/:478-1866(-)